MESWHLHVQSGHDAAAFTYWLQTAHFPSAWLWKKHVRSVDIVRLFALLPAVPHIYDYHLNVLLRFRGRLHEESGADSKDKDTSNCWSPRMIFFCLAVQLISIRHPKKNVVFLPATMPHQDAPARSRAPSPARAAESSSGSSSSSSSDEEEHVVVLLHFSRKLLVQTLQIQQDKGGQKEAKAHTAKASGKLKQFNSSIVHLFV